MLSRDMVLETSLSLAAVRTHCGDHSLFAYVLRLALAMLMAFGILMAQKP